MGLPLYVGLRYFYTAGAWPSPGWVLLILSASLSFLPGSPSCWHRPWPSIFLKGPFRRTFSSPASRRPSGRCLHRCFHSAALFIHCEARLCVSASAHGDQDVRLFGGSIARFAFRASFQSPGAHRDSHHCNSRHCARTSGYLEDFFCGLSLGNMIRLGNGSRFRNKEGCVIRYQLARTIIETLDGQRIFIPNSLLQTGIFMNFTAGSPANRMCLKVSAPYDVAAPTGEGDAPSLPPIGARGRLFIPSFGGAFRICRFRNCLRPVLLDRRLYASPSHTR